MTAHEIYELDRLEAGWDALFPPAGPEPGAGLDLADGVLPPAPTATPRGTLPGGGAWIQLEESR